MPRGFLALVVLAILVLSRPCLAQQYTQTSAAPLTAPIQGLAIDETGSGISVHTLNWTVQGTPTSCTIAIESAIVAAGPWSPVGSPQECIHSGTYAISEISANLVRVNLSAFAPNSASLIYSYGGLSTFGSMEFASASLWAKLDALRAVEALRHGIRKINHCKLFVPGPVPGGVPFPTNKSDIGREAKRATGVGVWSSIEPDATLGV
jgi:hypothetical protein